nr:hypothetical protein [Tanacetum cinerariifolium]
MPIFVIHVRAYNVEELFLMELATTAFMEMESHLHEPSYNQNYDGHYNSHESPSFPCCNYCGGSHETFQCQPMDQNVNFSSADQIQNPQYSDVHPLFQENPLMNDEFEAYTKANDDNINNLQIKFDHFQKKYEQKQEDFLNQMRNFVQNLYDRPPIPPPGEDKEYEATKDTKLPSTKDIQPLPVQEPPQNSDIRQLIREECSIEIFEEQEVKDIVEQPVGRGNRSIQSLQNFRVVHKSFISLNTSQISSIHAIAP